MKGKKIAYVITQAEMGGAQRYIKDLAHYFSKDNEVHIIFGEPGLESYLPRTLDALAQDNTTTHTIHLHWIPTLIRRISPFHDVRATYALYKLFRTIDPDIIHLNSSKISIIGTLAGVLAFKKKAICYTAHGWVFNEPMSRIMQKAYTWLERITSWGKSMIIVINKKEYTQAQHVLHIPATKLSHIYNGIDINDLQKHHYNKDESLARLAPHMTPSPDEKTFIIGTLANFYTTKGLQYFIEAIRILIHEKKLPVKAIIVGDGILRKDLERQIDAAQLTSHILLPGVVEDAYRYTLAFDIYVCSSVKEGLPYSIIEAMALQRPIVTTAVGGIPEMIDDTALLCQAKDPSALAQKIETLITDAELRTTLGTKAAQRAQEVFSVQAMCTATEATYTHMLR